MRRRALLLWRFACRRCARDIDWWRSASAGAERPGTMNRRANPNTGISVTMGQGRRYSVGSVSDTAEPYATAVPYAIPAAARGRCAGSRRKPKHQPTRPAITAGRTHLSAGTYAGSMPTTEALHITVMLQSWKASAVTTAAMHRRNAAMGAAPAGRVSPPRRRSPARPS